ncbi:MAG: TraB/GumN family protein [Siphonobacter sp.]
MMIYFGKYCLSGKIVFLVCLLLTTGIRSAYAQKSSLLWEISGKGLGQPSYLYGTFHLLCQQDLRLSDTTQAKFRQTEQLYLELDMDDPQEMGVMMTQMYMPKQTLKDFISAEDYAYLVHFFQDSLHNNLDLMNRMKPFVLMSMVYPKLLGCSPGSPELVFMQQAASQKKPIMGLEKATDQFAIFDKIGPQKGAKQLVEFVKEYPKTKQEFHEMLAIYQKHDIETLYERSVKQPEYAEQIDDLLWKRNANWIPIIESAIAQKPTFIAVGAGHLGGSKGVIALLKARGYQVNPIL